MTEKLPNYVGAGIQADYQMLLNTLETDGVEVPVTLNNFRDVWMKMRFHCIYYGCTSFSELLELTEELIAVAKLLWMQPNTLQKRVTRFFLLAMVYIKQPFVNPRGFIKIRISSDELKVLNQFYDECVGANYEEVSLLFELLFFNSAFSICLFPREYGMDAATRNKLVKDSDMSATPVHVSLLKDIVEDQSGLYSDLKAAFSEYNNLKCILGREKYDSSLPDELSFINENTYEELLSNVQSDTSTNMDIRPGTVNESQEDSIRQRRCNIKQQAFSKKRQFHY